MFAQILRREECISSKFFAERLSIEMLENRLNGKNLHFSCFFRNLPESIRGIHVRDLAGFICSHKYHNDASQVSKTCEA